MTVPSFGQSWQDAISWKVLSLNNAESVKSQVIQSCKDRRIILLECLIEVGRVSGHRIVSGPEVERVDVWRNTVSCKVRVTA